MSTIPVPDGSLASGDAPDTRYLLPVDENYDSREKNANHRLTQDELGSNGYPPITGKSTSRSSTGKLRRWVSAFGSWFRSDCWRMEILSLLITLVCFAGLIVVLSIYNKKTLPSWPSGLTLNALISWIATVLETTLLLPVASCVTQQSWVWFTKKTRSLADICYFDEASRGVVGSVKLIFRLKGLHLACLGAFVTVVALGLHPFFQQTIKYPNRPVGDPNSVAQVVYATSYDGQTGLGLGEINTASFLLPSNLKGAIYSGLWSDEILPPPSPLFSCPSGNCTFPLFASLAVNLKCANATSQVKLNCTNQPATSDVPVARTVCNFISPGDSELNATLQGSNENTFLAVNAIQPDFVDEDWGYLGSFTGIIAGIQWVKALSNFQNGFVSSGESGPTTVGPNTTWEAVQCVIYASVQHLWANVSAGIYSEQVIDEYVWDGTRPIDPISQEPLNLVPPFAKDQTFSISGPAFESIVSGILSVIGTGNVSTGSSTGFVGTTDLIKRFWLAENVTKIMENLCIFTTNSLRSNQSSLMRPNLSSDKSAIDPGTSINGTVWIPVPFVEVQWEWLVMPLTLYLLVGVLLFLTMVESSQRGVGVWKSSPLALLFHGLHDAERDERMQMANESSGEAMQTAADGMRVRLAVGRQGVMHLHAE